MTHGTPPFSADAALRHFRSYFTEPKDVVAHPQLSRDEKLAILREWEQDALRLSTSESEGMGGGEEHAWTGGRVHRGPGAIATMMHAAARFG
jgi:hypothetical protein